MLKNMLADGRLDQTNALLFINKYYNIIGN